MRLVISAHSERWNLRRDFRIARGSKSSAEVVVVTATLDGISGWGECVPYARFGESVARTLTDVARLAEDLAALNPDDARRSLPAGAAGNGIDCALWDLSAQLQQTPVWRLVGLPPPAAAKTAFTVTIDSVAAMAADARDNSHRPLLKVKLGGRDADLDPHRLRAVREAAPDSELIVDANEGWSMVQLERMLGVAAELGVAMIEQPLPASADEGLRDLGSPVPIGADESAHGIDTLDELEGKYQVLNIKLDKTGGLSRALALLAKARALEFDVMVGCMVATSLSMAPALLLTHGARFVDLDGPLLLDADRSPGLIYDDSIVRWPEHPFWGEPR